MVLKGNGTLHGRIMGTCNNDSSWSMGNDRGDYFVSMDNDTLHNDYECKRE